MNKITEREVEQYKRLTQLFEKYKGHKFNPFEKVLIYFKTRGLSNEFTIVPHIVWYYDKEESKHVLYDPTIRFTSSSLIPFDGNEEFIGFKGDTSVVSEIKAELEATKEPSPLTVKLCVVADYLKKESDKMFKRHYDYEMGKVKLTEKDVRDWLDKIKSQCEVMRGVGDE